LAVRSIGTGNGNQVTVNVSDIISLSTNDYVEIRAYHTSGGAKNATGVTSQTFLTVHRVS